MARWMVVVYGACVFLGCQVISGADDKVFEPDACAAPVACNACNAGACCQEECGAQCDCRSGCGCHYSCTSSPCEVECHEDSTCDVACAASPCRMRCREDAAGCVLRCGELDPNGGDCEFEDCDQEDVTDCGGGVITCRAPCPA